MSTIKTVGLIECGTSEKNFTVASPAIPTNFSLVKAFVFNESAKRLVSRRFPDAEMTEDCNAIIEDEDIELVVISSPTDQHRSLIGAALKARKNVQVV